MATNILECESHTYMDIIEEIPTVYNRMRLLRLARQSCPSYNSVRVKNKNVQSLSFMVSFLILHVVIMQEVVV
jgi:hypothetical protein